MKFLSKRLLSLLTVFCLLVSVCCVSVSAAAYSTAPSDAMHEYLTRTTERKPECQNGYGQGWHQMFNTYVGVVTSSYYSYGNACSANSWWKNKRTGDYKNIYRSNSSSNGIRSRLTIDNPGFQTYVGSDSYVTHSAYRFSWSGTIWSYNG